MRADSSRRHASRKRAPRQTAWIIATRPSRAADGFRGDAAAMSASSTAERRRFTRGRAAAAAASMARSARIAWFRRIEAKRAPSRVATTTRITPSVRPVTDASAAAASTKKSCASWPHRVIRASGMSAASAGPTRRAKPARDTLTTHASSAVLRIFALAQALRCLSAWWCSGGFLNQRTAARVQATETSCVSMCHSVAQHTGLYEVAAVKRWTAVSTNTSEDPRPRIWAAFASCAPVRVGNLVCLY